MVESPTGTFDATVNQGLEAPQIAAVILACRCGESDVHHACIALSFAFFALCSLGYPGKQQPAPRLFGILSDTSSSRNCRRSSSSGRSRFKRVQGSSAEAFTRRRISLRDAFSHRFCINGRRYYSPSLGATPQCRELAIPGLRFLACNVLLRSCFVLSWAVWLTSFLLIPKKGGKNSLVAGCSEYTAIGLLLYHAAWVVAKVDYPMARFCLPLIPLFTISGLLFAWELAARFPGYHLVPGSDSDDCDGCRGRITPCHSTRVFSL